LFAPFGDQSGGVVDATELVFDATAGFHGARQGRHDEQAQRRFGARRLGRGLILLTPRGEARDARESKQAPKNERATETLHDIEL
jgi:hypothetical protein